LQLLGLNNHDIDIAVEDMMGLAFATDFITYAETRGIQATVPAVLKLNPEQSKHLETTKIKIFDMEIDVVNLRSEEYAEVSRIPTGVVSLVYDLSLQYAH
jgi:tRNA nucleotidyltransferase (CCA-adding enzyme)